MVIRVVEEAQVGGSSSLSVAHWLGRAVQWEGTLDLARRSQGDQGWFDQDRTPRAASFDQVQEAGPVLQRMRGRHQWELQKTTVAGNLAER